MPEHILNEKYSINVARMLKNEWMNECCSAAKQNEMKNVFRPFRLIVIPVESTMSVSNKKVKLKLDCVLITWSILRQKNPPL